MILDFCVAMFIPLYAVMPVVQVVNLLRSKHMVVDPALDGLCLGPEACPSLTIYFRLSCRNLCKLRFCIAKRPTG